MEFLQSVFFFLLTLGILVSIHEYGHFIVARLSGVKILRFSVGFGRPLFMRHLSDGTEFVIAAIPLGGYVRMLDEREGPVTPEDAARSFGRLSPLWRIAIAVAGPFANIVLAVVAYWVIAMVGIRDLPAVLGEPVPQSIAATAGLPAGLRVQAVDGEPVEGLGDVFRQLSNHLGESGQIRIDGLTREGMQARYTLPVTDWLKGADEPDMLGALGLRLGFLVGDVLPGSAAERAGLRTGDDVVAVDGVPLASWSAFHDVIQRAPGRALALDVRRDGEALSIRLVPEAIADPAAPEGGRTIGRAGVGQLAVQVTHDPLTAVPLAMQRTWRDIGMTVGFMVKIVTGLVSSSNLSGPLTIAQVASASADVGFEYYVSVLALLSVSLAVLNLLPVPVLDGGHVVYAAVELVTGRAVPERIQLVGLQIGLFFVASLTLLALYNDVMRLLPHATN